ncbi:unnamed protein product [Bursaphelenchus okinawaensis]|uniref:Dynein light chain roadblock n=1 Tax=Bursaphelenchus okinawaensis TaxID=465554 RepID=A0A811K821_9BILA|nr:unnamed protein product [Bursaphelenchus okinawaensis]CAG9095238.1 unnamed protein product [Bursaphelenchus okinawaensis]
MVDVDETIKRIQSQKGVLGVLIMDVCGRPIRSTFDDESTAQYADRLHELCEKSRNVVKDLDQTNDLSFLRMRTKNNEIIIAPDRDYLIAVVSNKST